MDDSEEFERNKKSWASGMAKDQYLQEMAAETLARADTHHYPYQWTWMGMPIIQLSNDILAQQEIVWKTRPDLIVETGVARGGSAVFLASLMELMGEGRVLGIDIDIRAYNRKRIEEHPMAHRIDLLEGSSVDPDVVDKVRERVKAARRVMVILDSNHTHEHVLSELEAYAPMVSPGQYLVVADTVIEYQTPNDTRQRPWGAGNSPMSALQAYLEGCDRFELDHYMNDKLLYTATPGGYLRCVK